MDTIRNEYGSILAHNKLYLKESLVVAAALLKCLFSAPAMEMSSGLDKRVRERRQGGGGRKAEGGSRVLMRRAQPSRPLPSSTHAHFMCLGMNLNEYLPTPISITIMKLQCTS